MHLIRVNGKWFSNFLDHEGERHRWSILCPHRTDAIEVPVAARHIEYYGGLSSGRIDKSTERQGTARTPVGET